MSMKDAYVAKWEAQLHDLGGQLTQLKAKAQQAVAQGRIEYAQKLQSSQSQFDQVSKKFDELKRAGDAQWEALKAGLEGTWGDLKKSFDSIKA